MSGDLVRKDVSLQFDLQELPFPNQTFEIIYCSHVLQAVIDDESALAEIYRVLKPNGWAMINIPSRGEVTREFSLSNDPDRPADFVRIYGTDFAQTLTKHGFTYELILVNDHFSRDEQERMRVNKDTVGAIYLVSKSKTS